jgi:hypothetical protein
MNSKFIHIFFLLYVLLSCAFSQSQSPHTEIKPNDSLNYAEIFAGKWYALRIFSLNLPIKPKCSSMAFDKSENENNVTIHFSSKVNDLFINLTATSVKTTPGELELSVVNSFTKTAMEMKVKK